MSVRRALLSVLAIAAACAASCDPQKPDWGLDAIDAMKTPADDPGLGCGVVIAPDPTKAAARASCAYTAGAHASDSLGIAKTTLAQIPIRHVIVLMKENRSFDHLLGKLHDRGQPDTEGIPASYTNPDAQGNPVAPSHAQTTCIPFDPEHQSASMARCVDGGKMDGFVQNAAATTPSDGSFALQYYDDTDLPFYYWLASTFALGDRDFAPTVSGTYANRAFALFATNAGVVDTGIQYPPPNTPSIFQTLMNAGYTWGAYSDGLLLSGTLDWVKGDPGTHGMNELYDALDQGTLPNVAFVDGRESWEDDHPLADLQRGEAWVKTLFDHAVASPEWQRLAIVWTYDECGAFADHVTPPSACQAAPSNAPFTALGARVPLVVISPWAKRHFVSHVARDHTAILRLIEALFDLPALTARDANSDALLDMFDFSCGRDLSVAPGPAPGTGGCPNPAPPGAD
jgi:phospholipase C